MPFALRPSLSVRAAKGAGAAQKGNENTESTTRAWLRGREAPINDHTCSGAGWRASRRRRPEQGWVEHPRNHHSSTLLEAIPVAFFIAVSHGASTLVTPPPHPPPFQDLAAIANPQSNVSVHWDHRKHVFPNAKFFPLDFRPYDNYLVALPRSPVSVVAKWFRGAPLEECVSRTWNHVVDLPEPHPWSVWRWEKKKKGGEWNSGVALCHQECAPRMPGFLPDDARILPVCFTPTARPIAIASVGVLPTSMKREGLEGQTKQTQPTRGEEGGVRVGAAHAIIPLSTGWTAFLLARTSP